MLRPLGTTFALLTQTILIGTMVAGCRGQSPDWPQSPTAATTTEAAVKANDSEASSPNIQLLEGEWRAALKTPGGDLPFATVFESDSVNNSWQAYARNDIEKVPFSRVLWDGQRLELHIDGYDSHIVAKLDEKQALTGQWSKTIPDGQSTLPFAATKGSAPRFLATENASASTSPANPQIGGSWKVQFKGDDGDAYPARAELVQDGEKVTGTFVTDTGDYRYLEGSFKNGLLQLSCFDGAHAFLFHARPQPDGTLLGDFWSRDQYHASWTASAIPSEMSDVEAGLADPYSIIKLTNNDQTFRFQFPDLQGNTVSWDDERFKSKVVLVDIFGTWCPNCNDQAPLLASWAREYRERGLEVVGLAFEMTGDQQRDREIVGVYAKRHNIDFPLLLAAGTIDKGEAAKLVPDLSALRSYPTAILIGRDGKVREIYSGFPGPATGKRHQEFVQRFRSEIEKLLAEAKTP